MKLFLANPRGFCAGVDRAIVIVERAIELFGRPIYVRHEVVHNRYVVDTLKKRGAIFVEELDEVPNDATVIFSAHGVSENVREEALRRQLNVFDATCPLVTKVHMEVKRYRRWGKEVILIGHEGHPEVVGTMGQAEDGMYLAESVDDVEKLVVKDADQLAFVTQTTLSVDDTRIVIDALRNKFPNIQGPARDDICYATQNRQDAVRSLSSQCDVVLVVGSVNSSNSNRLRELAESQGCDAYLIDAPQEIDEKWFKDCTSVGVTAGASAPEILVQSVVRCLEEMGAEHVQELLEIEETMSFSVPVTLRQVSVKNSLAAISENT